MKKFTKRKKIVVSGVLLSIAVISAVALNPMMKTVFYTISTEKVSAPLRIALITALHSCRYGDGQKNLINAVNEQKPDVVLYSGDILDDDISYENGIIVLEKLAKEYPSYYVSGNHEFWSGDIKNIKETIENLGVTVLEGESEIFTANDVSINISGVDDPTYLSDLKFDEQLETASEESDKELFTVLMSHRPELFETYLKHDFDLILSGHAHGGQWRIPGILNGLLAPNQGLFPDYAGGRYDSDGKTMIVSRGLARETTFVPRVFNRPELVICDIVPN